MFGLVPDPHLFLGMFFRLPPRGDVHANARQRGPLFLGCEVGVQHLHQIPGDVLLVVQQRAPRDFHGMGREHGFHGDAAEHPPDGPAADAGVLQAGKDVFEAAGLGSRRIPQVGAPAANPVHLLGQVDHLEVGGKRANEIPRGVRRQGCEQALQTLQRVGVPLAVGDGRPAGRLDPIEQRFPALFGNHFTDKFPEAVNVVPQCLILPGEEYVRTAHGW